MSEILSEGFSDLDKVAEEYREKYQNANPFPNGYFDNFFNPDFLRAVANEFPDLKKEKEKIYYDNPNERKHASKGERSFGPKTKELVHFLNSHIFLEFLQKLTGIRETLIPDPYLEGGGFHEIKPGGFLKIHVDFHKHRKMNLDRRLNILIYLNENWEESYGGHFELWERDMSASEVKVAPLFNRLALFSTTGDSWHGHPDPLTCPPDRSRKSLALYYYSNGRPDNELDKASRNRITTTFSERKGVDSSDMKRYNRFVNLANDVLPPFLVRTIKKFRNK
ncbi:MAG: 2OG-Fe(II) oxygenase [Saprospirales bacterium]|nr:MAG: 2OG-Fe(II) oxygenase [Saprospirales bacterium]